MQYFNRNTYSKIGLLCALLLTSSLLVNAQQVDPSDNIPDNSSLILSPIPYPGIRNLNNNNGKYNYVRTIIPDQPVQSLTGSFFKRQKADYFDGLGRPLQTVMRKGYAKSNDIVNVHVYDSIGRETYQYLPYAAPTGGLYYYGYAFGNIKDNDSTQMRGFYEQNGTDEQPYSKAIFENSALNRIVKQMAPGKSWVGSDRGITYDYKANSEITYIIGTPGVYYKVTGSFPKFTIGNNAGDIPQYVGNYDEGELYITTVKDEDGKMSEEIKDKQGKVIIKRSLYNKITEAPYPPTAPADMFPINFAYTINVYDDLGRLRAVLSPEAIKPAMSFSTSGNTRNFTYTWSVNADQLNGLCYTYFYDSRSRVIEKKIPGKAVEYFIYDKRDRLVLSQDGNARAAGNWMFTVYDCLDRPALTGIYTPASQQSRSVLQNAIYSGNYNAPNLLFYLKQYGAFQVYPAQMDACKILSYNYYDDYTQGNLSGFPYDYVQFADVLPNVKVTPPQANASTVTRGLPTGKKIRVLDPENPSDIWLSSVFYYDDKGRIIQTQSQNLNGGLDMNSTVYFFQGMVYKTIQNHQNPYAEKIPTPDYSGNIDYLNSYTIVNTFERNFSTSGGNDQIWKHTQKINDGIEYELAFYSYDHLGRNVVKEFSCGRNYQNYNMHGSLRSIAFDSYNLDTVFNENLYYDKGFASKLYNGNIAGITWCGADRTKYRSYGYSYDNLNRLTHAQFEQKDNTGWSNLDYDYTVSELSYDLNGNIQRMVQMAPQVNSAPTVMDDLIYTYNQNSNQLFNVKDNGQSDASLPDFKDNANPGVTYEQEYDYDDNGNLISDDNKSISSITYNYLNKPEVITVDGKGTITYVYDAVGNRLQKRIVDTNNSTNNETWDYISGFVYNNNILQYILNEEGRSRPTAVQVGSTPSEGYVTKFVRDYFIKDHLGNVRSTITSKPIDAQYLASYELVAANTEELIFDNIANVRDIKGGGTPDDTYAARLNGGETDHRVGTAIMLQTKPGDRFRLNVKAFYDGDYTQSDETGTSALLESLASTLMNGTAPGGSPFSENPNAAWIQSRIANNTALASQLADLTNTNNNMNAPKAHLNYLWFNDKMQFDASHSGSFQVVQNANGVGGWINIGTSIQTSQDGAVLVDNGVPVPGNGFLIVYIDNQSIGKDVWFDNLNVENYSTEILEEDHYYPFGLTLNTTPMSTGVNAQPYKLTTKELEQKFDVNMYDFGARTYDMTGPVWGQIDELAEKHYDISPYAYCLNNPVRYNDPDGRNAAQVVDDKNKTITVTAVYYVQTKKEEGQPDGQITNVYSANDLKSLNKIDDNLNKKGYTVTDGDYAGYTVKFDLQFKEGGTLTESNESAKNESINGISTGNAFTVSDEKNIPRFAQKYDDSGQPTTQVGGFTKNHKEVTMNSAKDSYTPRVHELFHTFFFDHDNADNGIGTYYKQGSVNKNDINLLINNPLLPKIKLP